MDWYGTTDTAVAAELGKRLKENRLRKKLSRAALAQRAGISPFTVGQIENGKNSSLSSLIAMMRALRLLENFNNLAPVSTVSPVELLTKKGRKK